MKTSLSISQLFLPRQVQYPPGLTCYPLDIGDFNGLQALSLMKVQAYPWRWLPTPSPCPSPAADTPLPPLTLGTLPFHPFRDWQQETRSLFPVGCWGPGSPYRRKAGKAGPQRDRGRKKMPGRSPRGLLRCLGLDLIVLGAWPWARDTGVPASSSPSQGPASLVPSPRVLT